MYRKVGVSGSPMPRLITSIPSSRFASIRRSSSANMYGGIASRRWEGAARPFFLVGAAMRSRKSRSAEVFERPQQLRRELSSEERLGPARQQHRQVVPDLDLELASVELDSETARRPGEAG